MKHPGHAGRFATAAVFALGAAPLGACTAEQELAMGAVAVVDVDTGAARQEPQEPRRAATVQVDPAFTTAVSGYARQVMGLRDLGVEAADAEIRRALERLADAIELAPGAERQATASVAQQIRLDAGQMMFGLRLGPQGVRPVAHALEVSTAAMVQLAEGPYRDARPVGARVQELQGAVARLRLAGSELREPREEVVAALQHAALVLTAMHTAASRGVAR